jgi:hypothetical protein
LQNRKGNAERNVYSLKLLYPKKPKRSEINNLMMYLYLLEKKEVIPRSNSRWKEKTVDFPHPKGEACLESIL